MVGSRNLSFKAQQAALQEAAFNTSPNLDVSRTINSANSLIQGIKSTNTKADNKPDYETFKSKIGKNTDVSLEELLALSRNRKEGQANQAPAQIQQYDRNGINTDNDFNRLLLETADDIGADPLDLATAISYETGGTFDPTKAGPTTQWGQHKGLIQFGEPQAAQYGVDWNDPLGSQLGKGKAISNYFKSSGFKPGMSGLDLYSTINAGAPGKYSASDANNGGAPGDVRDKWENQMQDHRAKAAKLLGLS